MLEPCAAPPRWPDEIVRLCAALAHSAGAARQRARADLWRTLHAALFAALRRQAWRAAWAAREDFEDLASAKALELLSRAEEGSWSVHGRPSHEIAGYVAHAARNGIVDLARRRGRELPAADDAVLDRPAEPHRMAAPDDEASSREFAEALRSCVQDLAPRARDTWYRRAVLERSSREIAARSGVKEAHVDVIVQRARSALRECMRAKGHPSGDVHAGAFAEIWWMMERAWRSEVR